MFSFYAFTGNDALVVTVLIQGGRRYLFIDHPWHVCCALSGYTALLPLTSGTHELIASWSVPLSNAKATEATSKFGAGR